MRAWPEGVVVGSGIPGRFLRPETDGRVRREKNKNKKIKHPGEISKSYGEARLPKMYRNAKVKAEVGGGKKTDGKMLAVLTEVGALGRVGNDFCTLPEVRCRIASTRGFFFLSFDTLR